MSRRILVTGIGGIVGQGILRNIISLKENLILIGTDTEPVSAGNHLCDQVYEVPFSICNDYITKMKEICVKEQIDLIIPSTDYETYYLSLKKDELPTLACAGTYVSELFLNKYKTWEFFHKHKIPFARTALPSQYKENFGDIIVKPVEGRGSRDLHINPDNYKSFSDDYIIQELYKGKEVTTAFYITKNLKLAEELTAKINKHLDLRSSYNIQSIVTKNRDIIPFEVNGRVSGTNSIRSQFGFEDVRYIVEEYIFNRKLKKPNINVCNKFDLRNAVLSNMM